MGVTLKSKTTFIIYVRYEFYLKKIVCRGLQISWERIKCGFQRQIVWEMIDNFDAADTEHFSSVLSHRALIHSMANPPVPLGFRLFSPLCKWGAKRLAQHCVETRRTGTVSALNEPNGEAVW